MATTFTQADLDAAKSELLKLVKAVAYGDKSVTKHSLDEQLRLIAVIEASVGDSSGSGSRSTFASFRRD